MLAHFVSVVLQVTPVATEAKVVGASLFKNGYAVVLRKVEAAKVGPILVDRPPRSVLGTLWITASSGTRIDRVTAGSRVERSTATVANMLEFLKANVGKSFRLTVGADKVVRGKLVAVSDGFLMVDGPEGKIAIIPGQVTGAYCDDADSKWTKESETRIPTLRLETSGSPGSIFILSLEPGITWAPAYVVDISDPKTLRLTARATIVNDTLKLDNLELSLITGFPNIPFLGVWDPLTAGQTVQDMTGAMMALGAPGNMPRGGGGALTQNAARMAERFDEGFSIPTNPGSQVEDLFFYKLPSVKLEPGERGYFVLNRAEAPYEHVYEWSVADNVSDDVYLRPDQLPRNNEVWHSLKFNNTSTQPFTTSSCVTVKDGQILGQDMIKYVTPGAEASVRITKALDVQIDASEVETLRNRIPETTNTARFDEVSLEGTLRIRNMKSETIKLRVDKEVTGEVKGSTGNPQVVSLAKGLRAINPRQRLRWELSVKPGESLELKYTYLLRLRY